MPGATTCVSNPECRRSVRPRAMCVPCGAKPIRMYGWDSPSESWHGPNDLGYCTTPNGRLLRGLRAAPGNSWWGPVSCRAPGVEPVRMFALIHELPEGALALLYCDESKTGPIEVVMVLPAERLPQLTEELPFALLGFARLFGVISPQAELTVHEAVGAAIADRSPCRALVLSFSSGLWPVDLEPALSCCVEQVAMTLCQWLETSRL